MPQSRQKWSLWECGGGGPQALLQAPHTGSQLLVTWGPAPPPNPGGSLKTLGSGDRHSSVPAPTPVRGSQSLKGTQEASAGEGRVPTYPFQKSLPDLQLQPLGSPPHHTDFSRGWAGFRHLTSGQSRTCPGTGQQDPPDLVGTVKHALQASLWPEVLGGAHCSSPTHHLPKVLLSQRPLMK